MTQQHKPAGSYRVGEVPEKNVALCVGVKIFQDPLVKLRPSTEKTTSDEGEALHPLSERPAAL